MPLLLPNTQLPPTRSDFSKQSKGIPRSCSALAAAIPEEPAPIRQTRSEVLSRVLIRHGDAGPDVLRRALGALVGVAVAGQRVVVGHAGCRRAVEAPQVAVDHPRALAALVDRPDDQRLAAARVAGGEHARRRRSRSGGASTLPRASSSTPSCVDAAAVLGVQEAHRQQHQLGRQLALGARRPGANGGAALGLRRRAAPPTRAVAGEAASSTTEKSSSPTPALRGLLHRVARAASCSASAATACGRRGGARAARAASSSWTTERGPLADAPARRSRRRCRRRRSRRRACPRP